MSSLLDELPPRMHESGMDALALAQELIRMDTCQAEAGNVEALELLARFVAAAGASCEVLRDGGVAAGPVARGGRGPARVAPCGHIDTLPAHAAAGARPPPSRGLEPGGPHRPGAGGMKGAPA